MGAYLAKPITEKDAHDGGNLEKEPTRYGVCAMQGWRVGMEDAHLTLPTVDTKLRQSLMPAPVGVYGVFDGHGGPAVSEWISRHFISVFERSLQDIASQGLSNCEHAKANEGRLPEHVQLVCEALAKTFLSLDSALAEEQHRSELEKIHDHIIESRKKTMGDTGSLLEEILKGTIPPPPFIRIIEEKGERVVHLITSDDDVQIANNEDAEDETHDEFHAADEHLVPAQTAPKIEEVVESMADKDLPHGEVSTSGKSEEVHKTGPQIDEPFTDLADEHEATSTLASTFDGEGMSPAKNEAKPLSNGEAPMQGEDKLFTRVPVEGAASGAVEMRDVTPPSSPSEQAFTTDEHPEGGSSPSTDRETVATDSQYLQKRTDHFEPASMLDDDDLVGGMEEDHVLEESGKDSADAVDEAKKCLAAHTPEGCGAAAIVAAVLGGEHPYLIAANAGDSRCVLCRDGVAVAMSEDHKPGLDRETRRITNAGGTILNGRVDGNLNLSRTIGDLYYKTNDALSAEQQKLTAYPDVRVVPLTKQDQFAILACDGIWDCVSNQEAVEFVKERLHSENGDEVSLSAISAELCDRCLAQNPLVSDGGIGCDNMTCLIVLFGPVLKINDNPVSPAAEPLFYNEEEHHQQQQIPASICRTSLEMMNPTDNAVVSEPPDSASPMFVVDPENDGLSTMMSSTVSNADIGAATGLSTQDEPCANSFVADPVF